MSDLPSVTSGTLWAMSLAYESSAEALVDAWARGDASQHESAIYLLIGFSLELGYKSALMAKGWSAEEIKGLGHDLRRAHAKLTALGYASPHQVGDRLMDFMHRGHVDLVFRYRPAGIRPVVPHPFPAHKLLCDEIDALALFGGL